MVSFELEEFDEYVTVYNLEVDDFHTCFVGDAYDDADASVLVHNTYESRKEAYRQAKRDANIPTSQQPYKTERIEMKDAPSRGGHVQKYPNGDRAFSREYYFKNRFGEDVVIQEHIFPHIGSKGPHFNVRPPASRTKPFHGTEGHYNW